MSRFIKEFSSFSSGVNLRGEDPCGMAADRIEVLDAGGGALALQVDVPYASPNAHDTLLTTLSNADAFDLTINAILATGTTVGKVRVYWNRTPRQ